MTNNTYTPTTILQNIILFVAAIWAIFLVDQLLPLSQMLGLRPRSLGGIPGIVAMPFLHGGWRHIISNTVPLVVLLTLLAGTRKNSLGIIVSISLLGGVLLWLLGRGANHIGASLLVFGLAAYLIVHGIKTKSFVNILLSLLVAFIYGTTLLTGVSPMQKGVSWDGHLFGAVAGGLVAWFYPHNK